MRNLHSVLLFVKKEEINKRSYTVIQTHTPGRRTGASAQTLATKLLPRLAFAQENFFSEVKKKREKERTRFQSWKHESLIRTGTWKSNHVPERPLERRIISTTIEYRARVDVSKVEARQGAASTETSPGIRSVQAISKKTCESRSGRSTVAKGTTGYGREDDVSSTSSFANRPQPAVPILSKLVHLFSFSGTALVMLRVNTASALCFEESLRPRNTQSQPRVTIASQVYSDYRITLYDKKCTLLSD